MKRKLWRHRLRLRFPDSTVEGWLWTDRSATVRPWVDVGVFATWFRRVPILLGAWIVSAPGEGDGVRADGFFRVMLGRAFVVGMGLPAWIVEAGWSFDALIEILRALISLPGVSV